MTSLSNNNMNLNDLTYCLLYKSFLFVIMVTFYLTSGMTISAFESFNEKQEEATYKKGIAYRNENKWQEAIECFEPLAKKEYVKAQHNLAFCLFKIGEDIKAYRWARQASNNGFQPSQKDLARLNLMDLLLPIKIMTHVVSYFSMKEVAQFSRVSHRAYKAVRASVTSTNFLTSRKPYAVQFRSLFNNIHFEPQPRTLRFCLEAKVENGSLEVHFRDTKHLKRIVKETPLMRVRDKLYFVQDDHAQDDKELVATEGEVRSQYVIFFTADTPLTVSGELSRKLTSNVWFPEGSDISALKMWNQSRINMGGLTTYRMVCDLKRVIATFDDQLLTRKTHEALNLLKERRESRHQFPSKYPELQTICPYAGLIAAADLSIKQRDYIDAVQPLIYMASSIPEIIKLQYKLPTFEHPIYYINPMCAEPGVYCNGQLEVQKGFEISTDGDLIVTGSWVFPNYNLRFNVGGSLWVIFDQMAATYIKFLANQDITYVTIDSIIEMNKIPDKMSKADWNKLLQFWKKIGRI